MLLSSRWFLVFPALLWSTSTCTPERNFANHEDDGSAQGGASPLGGESGTTKEGNGGSSASIGGAVLSGGISGDGDGDGDGDGGLNGAGGSASGGSASGGSASGGSASGGSASGGSASGGSASGGSEGTLSEQLVLHLKMDEVLDATVATDSSGEENHATVENGNVSFVDGRFDKAAEFNGFGWLTVPDDPSLDETEALTMSAWVNFSHVAANYSHGIFAKRLGFGNQTAYTLFLWNSTGLDDSGNRMYVDIDAEDDANRVVSQTEFAVGNWYHVVAVFDGSLAEQMRVRIYIDGQLDREGYEASSQVGRHSASDLLIGSLPGGGEIMRGMIDEVALWRRALNAEEIAWLAQNEF